MFIKEYKEMLADRLLGNPSYSTEKEMQNLELLKTRFGEAALVHCEVMLQDIKDSKRINGNVQGQPQKLKERSHVGLHQMNSLVLSQHYWPSALSKADHPRFKLPAPLEEALDEYGAAFSKTRAKRNLQWKRAHGIVEITVQLQDRSLSVSVTPIHYAVLCCFQDGEGSKLSLQALASKLELPEALVRKHVAFWVTKGVLREASAGVFDLQESVSPMESASNVSTGHYLDEDVEHSPGQSVSSGSTRRRDQAAAELEACEPLIQLMLKNHTSLTLERMHNFLQMYQLADPVYTQTQAQLRDFLARLCQEGRLEFDGSSYSRIKPSGA